MQHFYWKHMMLKQLYNDREKKQMRLRNFYIYVRKALRKKGFSKKIRMTKFI